MDFLRLREHLNEHLHVTWITINPLSGRRIDVGEEFDMQVVVTNRLDKDSGAPDFVDVVLRIEDTGYASLVGDSAQIPIADRLGPGMSVQKVLRFKANAAADGEDPTQMEPVASVSVQARADLEALSALETRSRFLRAQIHGKESPA